jgi:hypothetical protein
MKLTHILASTALGTIVAFGLSLPAHAQSVDPANPDSARGGILAQSNQQPGTGSSTMPRAGAQTGSGMTGGQAGQQSGTMGGTAMPQGSTSGATAGPGSSMGGGSAQASRMNEEQIRSALQARGYSDISGLERDGDHFRINEAQRYGEKVEDLRVDARTGQVRDEERLSEDQARKLLQDRGYSEVSDVSRDGDTIRAKAKQGDREVNLRVDARSGVLTQQASN